MSTRISSFSGPYFPVFGLNIKRYSVSLRIQSKCTKTGTSKAPNMDTFHAAFVKVFYITHAETKDFKQYLKIL